MLYMVKQHCACCGCIHAVMSGIKVALVVVYIASALASIYHGKEHYVHVCQICTNCS